MAAKKIYSYRTESTPRRHQLRRLFPVCITYRGFLAVIQTYIYCSIQQIEQICRKGKGVSIDDDRWCFLFSLIGSNGQDQSRQLKEVKTASHLMCRRLRVVTEDRNAPGVENREIIFCFFNYDPPRRIFLILYLHSVLQCNLAPVFGEAQAEMRTRDR